ncbi:MAG: ATP-binding protein [Clostridia bacterium]|nr:ATP-binding protein [Clostridia bacterium]
MFLGRTKELNALNERYVSDKKHFGVIYGRRRIGKTEMVCEFLNGKVGIYFQAVQGTVLRNLKAFSEKVCSLIDYPEDYVFSSWGKAFEKLSSYFSGQRYCLVIDEYPFIASKDKSFSSIVQDFYDHSGDNLFLMLMGSDVSFLKNEITDNTSPLYKRRTFEINLGKMTLDEALLFLDGLSTEDKCNYLSLMSSYPYYLSSIDKNKSFEENVISLLLNRPCIFENLPDIVLSDTTRVQGVYNTILESVSHRHHSISEISDDIGEERTSVSAYVNVLCNCGILSRNETFKGNLKTHYYTIDDPMLRFWYLFVYPNQDKIHNNGTLAYENMKDRISDFLCRGFEDTAILYLYKLNSEGKLGTLFGTFKRYKADNLPKLGRSVELDAIAQEGNILLIAECKYRKKPFTNEMMEHLRESTSIFADKWERQYYIFSKSGFEDGFEYSPDIHCFTAEDIVG